MTIFKQYGEQRTGTNYLKHLLEINFADTLVFGSVLGWKHGLFQLNNGYASTSADSHEDWVRRKVIDGRVYSVDDHPLPYTEAFLIDAASRLNYLVSYKRLIPWLVSMKRFRFPNRPWERAHVERLARDYLARYRIWLQLPGALIVDHDLLLEDTTCLSLLAHLQERYGLYPRSPRLTVERPLVKASTDHGLLFAKETFDPGYYLANRYLEELPAWIIDLAGQPAFSADFIDQAAWLPPSQGGTEHVG